MNTSKKQALIVNVLFWFVGALLYPASSIVPTGSGEPPKFFSLLIPIIFIMLAYGSTMLMSRAIDENADASHAQK